MRDIAKAVAVIILLLIPASLVIGVIGLAFGDSLDDWALLSVLGIAIYGLMFITVWRLSVVKYRCGWHALGFRSFDLRRASISAAKVISVALFIGLVYGVVMDYLGLGPLEPEPVPVEIVDNGLTVV